MAITVSDTAKNALIDAIKDDLAAGTLRILESDDTVIVSFTLSNPAFTGSTAGVRTLANPGSVQASGLTGGSATAAKFDIRTSAPTVYISGTVTASGGGGDLIISNTAINDGDSVEITSLVIQV